MSGSTALLVALVSSALLLTGCTGSEEPTPGESTSQSADSGPGVAERDEEALVEQTVSNPDAPDDQATIGVVSLTVEDQPMVLRLVVTPDFASVSDAEEIALGDVWDLGAIRFGVDLRLIDRENLKEYSVIADTSGVRWSSTGSGVTTTNGEPMHAFAVFAAPEDDISTVDVVLKESWPEFTDVPISR